MKTESDLAKAINMVSGEDMERLDASCKKMLSILLSSEIKAEDKKRRLNSEFDIEMTKEMESEAISMCDYSKMVENKGIVEGLLAALKKMISNANMTAEQAMNILEIPEKERYMYAARLNK